MHLSSLDLNLLPLLHALLEEAHVARAARRVGLSASAASHGLTRLRASLDDPLLVRSGRTLVRTPRAERLLPAVQRVVEDLRAIWQRGDAADPRRLRVAIRLFAADDVRTVLLRPLDVALAREAPGVDVHAQPYGAGVLDRLRAGEGELAVAVFSAIPAEFASLPVYRDRLVAVARAGHQAALTSLSDADFAALSHVLVAPMGGPRGLVDDLLAARGLSRRVACVVPTFLDAVALVAERDHVAALPERLVAAIAPRFGLVPLAVDLPLPAFHVSVLWHRRFDADPPHRWFRERVSRLGRDLPEPGAGSA